MMKCERCKTAKGNTRDRIFAQSLLNRFGRSHRYFDATNTQRLCRECHDIKDQQWVQNSIFIDYRSEVAYHLLLDELNAFKLPSHLVRHGIKSEEPLEPWGGVYR